jgi:hypothetical protein
MELDACPECNTAPNGPPPNTGRLGQPTQFPLLALPDAGSNCMDDNTSCGVPHAKAETLIPERLRRLPASRQVEGLPTLTQTATVGNYLDILVL